MAEIRKTNWKEQFEEIENNNKESRDLLEDYGHKVEIWDQFKSQMDSKNLSGVQKTNFDKILNNRDKVFKRDMTDFVGFFAEINKSFGLEKPKYSNDSYFKPNTEIKRELGIELS